MRLINKLKEGDKVAYITVYNLLTAQLPKHAQTTKNTSDITYPLLAIKKRRGLLYVALVLWC